MALEVTEGPRKGQTVSLRQVTRRAPARRGAIRQVHTLTSRHDLPAGEVCWRMSSRWREENYLLARNCLALEALDSYAAAPDDPHRMVPNPAKKSAAAHLRRAEAAVDAADAEPDGPASLANQAIKDQALQISAGRAGEAPKKRPGGRAQITPLCAQSIAGHDLRQCAQITTVTRASDRGQRSRHVIEGDAAGPGSRRPAIRQRSPAAANAITRDPSDDRARQHTCSPVRQPPPSALTAPVHAPGPGPAMRAPCSAGRHASATSRRPAHGRVARRP